MGVKQAINETDAAEAGAVPIPEERDTGYKGDNPKIEEALKRVSPITMEAADWSASQDGSYGVIDGFIAVVDGRENLSEALKRARELIQEPQFEVVTVIRDSETLDESLENVKNSFYQASFGVDVSLSPEGMAMPGARQGTVLINPDSDDFYLHVASNPWSTRNLFRDRVGLDVPDFDSEKLHFWNKKSKIGKDFHSVFGTVAQVFPEYMSVSLSDGQSTSEPAVMHFDSNYSVKEASEFSIFKRRSYRDLPAKFIEAADKREFSPLPGGYTVTTALSGGGTIVRKTDPERYALYKDAQDRGDVHKEYFYDDDTSGHQGQDGDIMIIRGEGWPDDLNGEPRLPSDHCSTLINYYGHEGNHLGRVVGIMNSEVCYIAPQVRETIGASRLPDDNEMTPI
ncbi:MAG: hypothetical protein ACRBDL_07285 [Alphaproteobacteria bacterium]